MFIVRRQVGHQIQCFDANVIKIFKLAKGGDKLLKGGLRSRERAMAGEAWRAHTMECGTRITSVAAGSSAHLSTW